jgi:hypothetical protein
LGVIRNRFLSTLALACVSSLQAATLEKMTVRNDHRNGAGTAAPRSAMKAKIKHPAARKLEPQKISQDEINAILRRLQEIEDHSKKSGDRMGLIGDNGFKVFRYLAFSFMAKGWAAFPSYRHIAAKTNIARSTVGKVLRRLKHVGALKWTERQHRKNGRRVQGTNLFTLHMPSAMAKFLPRLKSVAKVVAKAVASVGKSAGLSRFFRGTDNRTHGATTGVNNSRLGAALANLAAARERKAERRGREGSVYGIAEPA